MIKINKIYTKLLIFLAPFITLYFLSLKVPQNRYFLFFTLCLWLAVCFIFSGRKLLATFNYKYTILSIFYLFIIGLSFNGSFTNTLKLIGLYTINLVPIFLFDFFYKGNTEENKRYIGKFLFYLLSLIILYLCIANVYYLNKNPMIARYLTSYDPSNTDGFGLDLPKAIGGGFNFTYGIVCIPPMLAFFIKNSRIRIQQKSILIGITIFLLYFLLRINFAIAFLISIIFTILIIFSSKNKVKNSIFLYIGTLITILLIFSFNDFTYILANLFNDDSIINQRLIQLGDVLNGIGGTSSVKYRIENNIRSLESFISSPFIGKSYLVGFDYRGEAIYIGQHSEWFDLLARYGLLGGIPIVSFIYISFKELYIEYNNSIYRTLVFYIILMAIYIGFLNPFLGTTLLMIVFIYVPSCIEFIRIKEH